MKIEPSTVKILALSVLIAISANACGNSGSKISELCQKEATEQSKTDCSSVASFSSDLIDLLSQTKPYYKEFYQIKKSGDQAKLKEFLVKNGKGFREGFVPQLFENPKYGFIADLGSKNNSVTEASWQKRYNTELPSMAKDQKETMYILSALLSWGGLRGDAGETIKQMVDMGMAEAEAGQSVELYKALMTVYAVNTVDWTQRPRASDYALAIQEDFKNSFPANQL
jgi:hypothetical protein